MTALVVAYTVLAMAGAIALVAAVVVVLWRYAELLQMRAQVERTEFLRRSRLVGVHPTSRS